ncbi:MAG: alpha/beta fold hydrolase [Thermomicrobiales bacterium]
MMQRRNYRDGALRHHWSTVDGRRIYARVSQAGDASGASVVFVHGLALSSRSMVRTLARLGPTCTGYALDLPGFGRSAKPPHILDVAQSADVLAAWLDANGLADVTLVGHSYGCQVVVDCAVRHAERVGGIALLSPTMDRAARTAPRQIARWLRETPREMSMGPVLLADTWDAGTRRVIATFRDALTDRIEEKLPHVRMPALVIRGAHDPIVPQRWAEEVTRLLPLGRLTVVPETAHSMNYTAPDRFVRVLLPFVHGRCADIPTMGGHIGLVDGMHTVCE